MTVWGKERMYETGPRFLSSGQCVLGAGMGDCIYWACTMWKWNALEDRWVYQGRKACLTKSSLKKTNRQHMFL